MNQNSNKSNDSKDMTPIPELLPAKSKFKEKAAKYKGKVRKSTQLKYLISTIEIN
jgi:hypothetical protein